jgi:hypothetical protein
LAGFLGKSIWEFLLLIIRRKIKRTKVKCLIAPRTHRGERFWIQLAQTSLQTKSRSKTTQATIRLTKIERKTRFLSPWFLFYFFFGYHRRLWLLGKEVQIIGFACACHCQGVEHFLNVAELLRIIHSFGSGLTRN